MQRGEAFFFRRARGIWTIFLRGGESDDKNCRRNFWRFGLWQHNLGVKSIKGGLAIQQVEIWSSDFGLVAFVPRTSQVERIEEFNIEVCDLVA